MKTLLQIWDIDLASGDTSARLVKVYDCAVGLRLEMASQIISDPEVPFPIPPAEPEIRAGKSSWDLAVDGSTLLSIRITRSVHLF